MGTQIVLKMPLMIVMFLSVYFPMCNGRKMTVTIGARIYLPCRLLNDEKDDQVIWYRKNTPISIGMKMIEQGKRFKINKPAKNELNLVIKRVEKADDGTFTCKTLDMVISEIDLKVQWKPDFIESKSSPYQVTMAEGSREQLKCEAVGKPKPTITWYRRPQRSESRFTEIGVTGDTLTLHNVTRYVNDVFMCNASNKQGSKFREMNVTVNFPPDAHIMEKNMHVQTEDLIMVTCLIQGSPLVAFYWKLKGGQKIEDDWKYMVYVEHEPGYPALFMTLIIRANTLHQSDFGTYVCHADGLGHEAEDEIRIEMWNRK